MFKYLLLLNVLLPYYIKHDSQAFVTSKWIVIMIFGCLLLLCYHDIQMFITPKWIFIILQQSIYLSVYLLNVLILYYIKHDS